MNNPLSISTGFIYRLLDNANPNYTNTAIDYIKNLPINGVELCLITKERLINFSISEENLSFLRKLGSNSIHAPEINFTFEDNEESRKLLRTIENVYNLVNAKNVVFHDYSVKDFRVLNKYDFTASVENYDSRGHLNTIEKVKDFLNKNNNIKFTYDLAHALDASPLGVLDFLDDFKERLIECHISKLKEGNHWFLHKSNINDLMSDFKKRVSEDITLVNESVVWNTNQIRLFKDEIDYLKRI